LLLRAVNIVRPAGLFRFANSHCLRSRAPAHSLSALTTAGLTCSLFLTHTLSLFLSLSSSLSLSLSTHAHTHTHTRARARASFHYLHNACWLGWIIKDCLRSQRRVEISISLSLTVLILIAKYKNAFCKLEIIYLINYFCHYIRYGLLSWSEPYFIYTVANQVQPNLRHAPTALSR